MDRDVNSDTDAEKGGDECTDAETGAYVDAGVKMHERGRKLGYRLGRG